MSDYNRDLTDEQLQILCILVQYLESNDDVELRPHYAWEKVRVALGITDKEVEALRIVTKRYVIRKLGISAKKISEMSRGELLKILK